MNGCSKSFFSDDTMSSRLRTDVLVKESHPGWIGYLVISRRHTKNVQLCQASRNRMVSSTLPIKNNATNKKNMSTTIRESYCDRDWCAVSSHLVTKLNNPLYPLKVPNLSKASDNNQQTTTYRSRQSIPP